MGVQLSGTASAQQLEHCYEPDAVLVPQPGTPLAGAAQRIPAHEHLLSFGLPMAVSVRHVYVAGDIALLIVDWTMTGTSAQGFHVDLAGEGTHAPDTRKSMCRELDMRTASG